MTIGCVSGLVLLLCPNRAGAQDYFEWDGKELLTVRNGDPLLARNVVEWQVWLYRRSGGRWGIVSRPTAARAMEERRRLHEQEERANTLCRCEPSNLTYSIYTGPIAITERKKTPIQRAIDLGQRLKQLRDQAEEVRDNYNLFADRQRETAIKNNTPFDGRGEVMQDYALTVQKALMNLTRARALLEDAHAGALNEVAASLSTVDQLLTAELQRARLERIPGRSRDERKGATPPTIRRRVATSPTIRRRVATSPGRQLPLPTPPAVTKGSVQERRGNAPLPLIGGGYHSSLGPGFDLFIDTQAARVIATVSWKPQAMPGVIQVRQNCSVSGAQTANIILKCPAIRVRASIVVNDEPASEYDIDAVTLRLRRLEDGSLTGYADTTPITFARRRQQ